MIQLTQQEYDELINYKTAIETFELYFKSGNDVAVERAVILKSDFDRIVNRGEVYEF